jgi:hypothetical protein
VKRPVLTATITPQAPRPVSQSVTIVRVTRR